MYKRNRHKVTDLAKAAGISRQTLSRIVNNTASSVHLSTLEKLCRALDCAPGDLLVMEDDTPA